MFDALGEAGVETAVLSNTNDEHWRRLNPPDPSRAEFPTLLRADHHFASHIVGFRKPDARIFEAVEAYTGHRGARILFFDDLEAHVEAARIHGWLAELIDPTGDTAAQLLEGLKRRGVIG